MAVPEEIFAGVDRRGAVARADGGVPRAGGAAPRGAASRSPIRCPEEPSRRKPRTACARSRRARLGGNIDIRQLVAGSRLWLPVDVPGALFSIGDLHFAQGDGEVCGTAIEVAGAVTFRLSLHDGPAPAMPRYETPAAPRSGALRDDGHPGRRRHEPERRRARGADSR